MITNVLKNYDVITNEFCSYKIIKNNITSDVPLDPANSDYQAIQKWIAEGNTVIDNRGNN